MRKYALHRMGLLGLFSLMLAIVVCAPQRAAADDDDPPTRVARLSFTHGAVSFQPAGTEDWVSAVVNRPMTTGDKLWSDNDSRAELHIGSASVRLSGNTGFSFLNLTDRVTQIRLSSGTIRIRVKRLDEDETFEVDTPNLAFSVLRTGTYKINVNEGGDATMVKIRRGEGEVTGGGAAYTVHAEQAGVFTGAGQLDADIESYGDDDDDFDQWCADRDRHEDRSVSARYVSPDVIGYEDLDDNGGWRPVPGYGTVWFPHTTIVGWAPYHYGHWAYIAPWGYTWVDDAPWGFAPFHYGRWVNVGGVWGWVPAPPPVAGVVYVRPVYAPALVAWVGGPHFGIGIGVGGGVAAGVSVGWFPLGPREVFVPSYPVSRTYVNNINVSNTTVNTTVVNNYYNTTVVNKNTNVTNNTNITNNNVTVNNQRYVNQGVPGAVAATSSQAFTSAQPVARNAVAVNEREVASAPVNALTPSVAPSRQAVMGTGAAAAARPPAELQNRAVVAKVAPPPPPASFARQQQAIQANGGKPLAMSQMREMQPANAPAARPNVRMAPPAAPQNGQANRPGAPNNPGQPAASQNGQANRPGAPNNPGQPAASQNGQANRPGAPNNPGQPAASQNGQADRPGAPNNPGQPAAPQNGQANRPGNAPPGNANPGGGQKSYNDRPPSSRPNGGGNNASNANGPGGNGNPQLDQKHQQQLEQLRTKQDQERQQVEQQQQQDRQKLSQKNNGQQEQQSLNQKHQQQLEQLEQKHNNEEHNLQQKQQQERQKQERPAKPEKSEKKEEHPH